MTRFAVIRGVVTAGALATVGIVYFALRSANTTPSISVHRARLVVPQEPQVPIPSAENAVSLLGGDTDQSLSVDQYIEMGFPSTERDWTQQDLSLVAAKLQTLAETHPEQLPMSGSQKSGRLFAKVVDPQSLGLLEPRSLPPQDRLNRVGAASFAVRAILATYHAATPGHEELSNNLVDFVGAELRISRELLQLEQQILASTPADDPQRPACVTSDEHFQKATKVIAFAAVVVAVESNSQDTSPALRMKLLGYCHETVPEIVARLSQENRKDILEIIKFEKPMPHPDAPYLSLVQLRDEVNTAINSHTP